MVPEPQTLSFWAQELGGDQRTIARKLGGVKPARVEGRRRYYWLRDVVEALLADERAKAEQSSERTGIDELRYREQMARTRLLEADANERDGDLVRIDDIEWEWQGLVSACRAHLLSVPHKLAPIMAAESDVGRCNELLTREIHSALAELARGDGRTDAPGESAGAGELSSPGPADSKPVRAAAKSNGKRVGRRKPNPKP